MDVLMLSRLQFAAATFFHFLFVPLTLGLSILIAIMETKYVRTGDEEYRRMAKFWGRIFLVNFAVGRVAAADSCSALWIIIANAWMQHPVGYVLRNGRAEMSDFVAVIPQPFAIQQYFHTVCGAYILSGFVVMGISAYHLLRRAHTTFFTKSFRP